MTWARLLRTSTTASRMPGRRFTAFSTDPAQAAQLIPRTERRAVDSER